MSSVLKRLSNLWTLSGVDLSELEEKVQTAKKRRKQAKVIELVNPIDRVEI